jgi:hypothetical protein
MGCNGILTLATMFFLAIWGWIKTGITEVTSKIQNYLWVGKNRPCRTWVAWSTHCLKKWDGGLGLVNRAEAATALMYKWVIVAMEPRLSNYQAYSGGN